MTPASCKTAISASRRAFATIQGAIRSFGSVVPLVSKAAQAGAAGDTATIYGIAGTLRTDNARWTADALSLRGTGLIFNANASACTGS